jgi:ketosteroid isomerase-like protein
MSPEEFMCEYEATANTHDLEATLALIAEDAVYLFSNESSHVGKDTIRKAIQRNFDTIKAEKYAIHDLIWLAQSDDVAVCIYEFDWSGEIHGKLASGGGRGTTVIQRAVGRWRVVHEHLSRGRLTDKQSPP